MIKRNDILLAALFLILAAAGFFIIQNFVKDGSYVRVTVDGVVQGVYPLDSEGTYTIKGYDGGYNTMVIENGQVSFSEADCPDGLCVKMGQKSQVNESIVCLPHRVVAEVCEADEKAEFDAVSK